MKSSDKSLVDLSEHWSRLKEVLADALEEKSKAARIAILQRQCADDPLLLRQATELLSVDTAEIEECAESMESLVRPFSKDRTGERLGPYAIVKELGRGGMGSVYLAERADGQFQKQVAIKILKPGSDSEEVLRRSRTERQILAQLEHPSITRLLDAGTTDDGLPYFVMEYVDGRPISTYIRDEKLSLEERLDLFLKVCSAVAFAHRHQVIHRDIKPGNVLVTREGEPKLLDFGIAKLTESDSANNEITQLAERRLTPAYASPEQIAGNEATTLSDIYSLGALLRDMVYGKPDSLLSASSERGKTYNRARGIRRIIARATSFAPEERYPFVGSMTADVRRQMTLLSGRKMLTHPLVLAAAVVVFAFLLAGIVYSYRHRSLPMASGTAAAVKPHRTHSIAVLPFTALGQGQDNKLLGLGMADAIIGRMSGLRSLTVLPTVAVAWFEGTAEDAITAGKQLQADEILSGTVQRIDDRVRVTVQLADVTSRQTLWAGTFNQTFSDIFTIQDSIAEKVAQSLAGSLSAEDQKQLAKHQTTSTAAYDSYLQGLSYYNLRTKDGIARAIEYFQQAAATDPGYALAYALLSDCYFLQSYYMYAPRTESMAKAKVAAEQALHIDSSLAEGYLALAMVQDMPDGREKTTRLLQRAIELNPNLALAHQRYAWQLCNRGKLAESLREMKRAQELDPLSATNNTALGVDYIFARQFDQGLFYCKKAADLNPHEPYIQANLGDAYLLNGKYQEAIECFQRSTELNPDFKGDNLASTALAFLKAGKKAKSEASLQQALTVAAEGQVDPYNFTTLYAARGDKDEAFKWLSRYLDHKALTPGLVRYDPLLDPLRDDPRFKQLLLKSNHSDLLAEARN